MSSHDHNHCSRRTMISLGAVAGAAAGLLPRFAFASPRAHGDVELPHFCLEILYRPGWDPSYLFDGRPLAMTQAGLIQNYIGTDPTPLTDGRGGQTLVSPLFDPLRPHFAAGHFSILNGVHMATAFDGHGQNVNFLLSGNPFGGDIQLPMLNIGSGGSSPTPLDYLQFGFLFDANITNGGKGVPLDARSGANLVKALSTLPSIKAGSPVVDFLQGRFASAAAGAGAFAGGARAMAGGLTGAAGLADNLRQVKVDPPTSDGDIPLGDTLKYIQQCFTSGMVRSAVIEFLRNIDTHDATSAKAQPDSYKTVGEELAQIFDFLATTPLAEGSSTMLIDCTTVLVSSEFSRTMRQNGSAIDATGTDHNPLCNTVLLGGRGIKGGLIIGASDRESATAAVSQAHASIDDSAVKVMGKPFDFAAMAPTTALPTAYDPADYLTFPSVANSLFQLFGVDPAKYWTLGRNLPAAKVLGPELILG